MAEEYSKQNIFKSQIKAAAHSSEHFNEDADALLARIFACNHCFLDYMTIDAIVPIPEDVMEDNDEFKPNSKAAVEGRLFMRWEMTPDESPDGSFYQSMCIMPYKSWEDFSGDIRLRQETPNTPKIKEMVKRCLPGILKDNQVLFQAYDDGSPIDTFDLEWDMFEEFGPEAQDDYSRLEVVLKLLRESTKSEAITMLLDENYCPARYKVFEMFAMHKPPVQKFTGGDEFEESEKPAAEADNAPDEDRADMKPEDNKDQD